MNSGALLEITNLVLALSSLIQNESLYNYEVEQSTRIHHAVIGQGKSQHDEVMKGTKYTFLVESLVSVVEHFQQLDADLLDSARDSERDMFDQKNRHHQTIILSSSAMFSALATVIIQGTFPESTNNIIIISYALSSSFSFAFLFISIILCIQIVRLSSEFMYTKALLQRKKLSKVLKGIQRDFGNINGDLVEGTSARDAPIRTNSTPRTGGTAVTNPPRTDGAAVTTTPRTDGAARVEDRRAKLVSDNGYIVAQWENHMRTIELYLQAITNINRELLDTEPDGAAAVASGGASIAERRNSGSGRAPISLSAPVSGGAPVSGRAPVSGLGMSSFELHWKEHLKNSSLRATECFFLGTAFLQVAILLYLWALFELHYSSRSGAIISVTIIGLALLISLYFMRKLCFNTKGKIEEQNTKPAENVSLFSYLTTYCMKKKKT